MTDSTSKYFELIDDLELENRWFLGSPTDREGRSIEPDLFTGGREVRGPVEPFQISVRRRGVPLDWTFADFDMPVVRTSVLNVLRSLSTRVQSFSAAAESETSLHLLNLLDIRDCVDESRSEFVKWRREDGRPDRTGQYRQISRLRVSPDRSLGSPLFRLQGWAIAIIAAESVRREFERHAVSGVRFLDVS